MNDRSGAEAARPRHWWVNHRHSDRAQIDGSYLWLPERKKTGSSSQSQHNMTRLLPGDILFSCAAASIAAVGFVLERARPAPAPAGEAAQRALTDQGWLVPVSYVTLAQPLQPRDRAAEIRRLMPPRQSPLLASGEPNPNIFLAQLPAPLAELLRRLMNRQVEDCEARIDTGMDGRLAVKAMEEHIWQRADLAPREQRQLIIARAGQGIFRERVEQIETACRVTGVLDRRYLRATHIKPWKDCDDSGKLDGCNGLLLSPHVHHLFERGHMTFSDEGALLLSRHLNPYVLKAWGLERTAAPRAFTPQQRVHLNYHRQQVFEKIGGGRRSQAEMQLESDSL